MADDQTPKDAEKTLYGLEWPRAGQSPNYRISLADLLIALQFLGTDTERQDAVRPGHKWDDDTPGSLQVLKSGVTEMTKWWLKRAGVLGGGTGVAAAIGGVVIGVIKPFREALGDALVVALIAGGAVIIAATVLALAHFVTGDLMARAHATAARSAARAEVTAGFLRSTDVPGGADDGLRQELVSVLGAFDTVHVRVKGNPNWVKATAVRRDVAEGFQVRLSSGDWKPLGEVEQYTTEPD